VTDYDKCQDWHKTNDVYEKAPPIV
jgi:hypothetical protein